MGCCPGWARPRGAGLSERLRGGLCWLRGKSSVLVGAVVALGFLFVTLPSVISIWENWVLRGVELG